MTSSLRTNAFFRELEAEHRRWLSAFDGQYLANWEKVLHAHEEAAFAEARAARMLRHYGATVEPNEDLTRGSPQPDFRCFAGGDKFYVEVTCISTDIATAKTGIPVEPHGVTACRPLTGAVFSECRGKATQCSNVDAPALVAIGTFHTFAAMHSFNKPVVNWVLTGETKSASIIDIRTGSQVGDAYQITELHSAAFLRPDQTEGVGYARSSISGLLLCGLGSEPPRVLGVLHPNPARPFNPSILPQIEFGQVAIDRASRQLQVLWPGGDHE